ncbi:MAG: hypothetical protein ABSH05_17140 [Bryobacteraceae bacterium]|jgi:hypothetical protein
MTRFPTPDYLLNPPAVIPIDTGGRLFIDDFLVQETALRRTFHRVRYYRGSPVLKADRPWEFSDGAGKAMPFSNGVFYDPDARLFKIWYMGGDATLHATSRYGVRWEKPSFDVRRGTNIGGVAFEAQKAAFEHVLGKLIRFMEEEESDESQIGSESAERRAGAVGSGPRG